MTETVPEDPWAAIADELLKLANDARRLVGHPAPCLFSLSIQPFTPDQIDRAKPEHRATTIDAADAVAEALLGKQATTYKLSGGTFHYGADGYRGPVEVRIYQQVAGPSEGDKDAEIANLRARVAELEAGR